MEFNIKLVTRDKIIEMLKEEQNVRYSKGIQEVYTKQYYAMQNNNYEKINIEREIQKFILRKFGFIDNLKSLEEYWKIPFTYWNDEEVKNSIFYMKLNIFQYTKLNIDDDMVNTQVINYKTNKNILLSELLVPNKPLIILAGSMT